MGQGEAGKAPEGGKCVKLFVFNLITAFFFLSFLFFFVCGSFQLKSHLSRNHQAEKLGSASLVVYVEFRGKCKWGTPLGESFFCRLLRNGLNGFLAWHESPQGLI